AVDMRMLVTAIKVNTDLERIGDHSANIAKHVPFLAAVPSFVYEQTRIQDMGRDAGHILNKTRAAFLSQDSKAAHEILPLDADVDRLYKNAFAKIIELGEAHSEYAEGLAYLLIVTKSLERICDHAMNIAESVIFQVDGTDIRHQRNQKA
ncbi:MAG: phosphate transport system regulatory protein PhoU, partial [Rhodothermales bacterium]|nr:phosphate transport system regulatory protein PhoU [Rhodothermales bacterium]